MKHIIHIGLLSFFLIGCQNENMLTTIESQNDIDTAVHKLERIIQDKGLTHFLTIDHKDNAEKIGLELNPDTVVIFGNPKVGTLLMQCNPSLGIDLPLRILFKTDNQGNTTISYFNPELWKLKYHITNKKCLKILKKTKIALDKITHAIAK